MRVQIYFKDGTCSDYLIAESAAVATRTSVLTSMNMQTYLNIPVDEDPGESVDLIPFDNIKRVSIVC